MDIISDTTPSTSFIGGNNNSNLGSGSDVPNRPRRMRTDDVDFPRDSSSTDSEMGASQKNFGSMNDTDGKAGLQGGGQLQVQGQSQADNDLSQQTPVQLLQNALKVIAPQELFTTVGDAMQYPLTKALVGIGTFYLIRRFIPSSIPSPLRNGAALIIQQAVTKGLTRAMPQVKTFVQTKMNDLEQKRGQAMGQANPA